MARVNRSAVIVFATAFLWTTSQVQRVELGALVGGSSLLADFGITAAGAGLLLGVYFPLSGIAQIPAGIVADFARPRRLLVLAGISSAVSTIGLAAAPTVPVAMLARGATGVSAGFLWLASLKLLSLLPAVDYSRAVGTMAGFGAAGVVLGLSLIPAAAATWPWQVAVVASGIPCLAAALFIALMPVPAAPVDSVLPQGSVLAETWRRIADVRHVLGRRASWVLWAPQIAWTGTMSAVLSWLPRFGRDTLALSPATLGVLPALMPVGLLAGNAAANYFLSRVRQKRHAQADHTAELEVTERAVTYLPLFYGAAAGYAVILGLLITLDLGPPGVAMCALALGLLSGSAFLAQAHMAELAEPRLLGTATGVVNCLGFFAAFVFPWLMGIVMDLVDRPATPDWRYSAAAYHAAFAVVAIALAGALVVAWLLARRVHRQQGRTWARTVRTQTEPASVG